MPLDLKNPHPMKIQIFGPFLQQLDAAIFHMEIQIILTNGLQIPKSICSYLKIRELMFLNGRQQNFQN